MIVVGAVTIVGLVVERLIVTDREAIEMTLDKAVAAVKANDIDRLLECISPSAKDIQDQSRWVLSRYVVESAWIRNLEITVNNHTSPPTAKAKFTAIGQGKDNMGQVPYRGYSVQVVVDLRKEGDRWLVTGYGGDDYLPQRR